MASSYSSWCWRIFPVPSNKYSMHHSCSILPNVLSSFLQCFFFFLFFFTWSQTVSAGSVTEVDWKISHKTKVTEMMVFWSLWASAESEVQHQVSSWTVPKTARSHWVADLRSPFFVGKTAGWIWNCQACSCWVIYLGKLAGKLGEFSSSAALPGAWSSKPACCKCSVKPRP